MFYEFHQNNANGELVVDSKLCSKLYIEAHNDKEAISKAETLGCYWDGVEKGVDCPEYGDRWEITNDTIELELYIDVGYSAYVFGFDADSMVSLWNKKYGKFKAVARPQMYSLSDRMAYVGRIAIDTIEEYAQINADEYGVTSPDVRVYFLNGNVKEFYKTEVA